MTPNDDGRLAAIFHRGAADASGALAKWLGRPAAISVDRFDTLPIAEAAAVMGSSATLICSCAMRIDGAIGGLLLLAADDDAGLSLADTLLERPAGTSTSWGDLERSAVVETANIVGCAYLNAICAALGPAGTAGILPSPPVFLRDFPEAVMEGVLMEQPELSDIVLVARTEFRIDGAPIDCGLVFLPDAASVAALLPAIRDPEGRP
jgi:chemotaxis protein CheC